MATWEQAFSILYRIEWVVTTQTVSLSLPAAIFQYPVSDRMGCNLGRWALAGKLEGFQYPVSDRMGCNLDARADAADGDELSVSCIGSNGL